MLKILNLSMIMAFFINGCNQTGSDLTVRKWYYEDGSLKKVQEFLGDTIEHGTYMFYNEDGILLDSSQIKHGKFHGKRFLYYDNGSLKRVITYKNDLYRNSISYDVDGNIEFYRAYNYSKDMMFLAKFDNMGSIIQHQGDPIYSWVLEESYTANEIFNIELLVPDIPNHKVEVIISDLEIPTKNAISNEIYSPDEFNRIVYTKMRTPSEMQILNLLRVRDKVGDLVITDTLVFKISETGQVSYSKIIQ